MTSPRSTSARSNSSSYNRRPDAPAPRQSSYSTESFRNATTGERVVTTTDNTAGSGGRSERGGRGGQPRSGGQGRGSAPRTGQATRTQGGRGQAPASGAATPSGGPKARGSEAIRTRQQLDKADRRSEKGQGGRPQSVSARLSTQALFANEQKVTTADGRSFAELGVPAPLVPALTALGAASPFPIQSATLEATLAGKDVLGRGRTGSGKTIAFAIPLVARLMGGRSKPGFPRGLVLVPTRELALQVEKVIAALAKPVGLKTMVVFGGVGYGGQTAALRAGADIVIACPGRLEDIIHTGSANLSSVEVTVLDEADHMADLGFLPGVRRLLKATDPTGQRLLFSATLDNGISVLVNDFLTDPAVFSVDDAQSKVETLEHHVFAVSRDDRNQVVRELADSGDRRLLFTRTKHAARKWAEQLTKSGINAVDLHGNLSQNARERNLAAFSSGSAKVLVATDIAARGIHVDDIALVVHIDPPTEHKAYLHRSGRTARAGAAGTVVTIMLPEQRSDVQQLMRQAGITPTTSVVTPGATIIGQLSN
ncbi:MAG: DEAD/DEAH box helicase [Nakamurella sp.]